MFWLVIYILSDFLRKVQSNDVGGSTSDLLSDKEKDAEDDDDEEEDGEEER